MVFHTLTYFVKIKHLFSLSFPIFQHLSVGFLMPSLYIDTIYFDIDYSPSFFSSPPSVSSLKQSLNYNHIIDACMCVFLYCSGEYNF
jgi:hypothetical protein